MPSDANQAHENPFMMNQELLKLQMPDHRNAIGAGVAGPEGRPESKKGFDITPMGTASQENNGARAGHAMRVRKETPEVNDMDDVEEPVPLNLEPFAPECK